MPPTEYTTEFRSVSTENLKVIKRALILSASLTIETTEMLMDIHRELKNREAVELLELTFGSTS